MRIRKTSVEKAAEYRKPGYLEKVALADIGNDPDFFEISKEEYDTISRDFAPAGQPARLARAVAAWAAKGFPVPSAAALAERQAACGGCQERAEKPWGFSCKLCGCTGAKLLLETEKCPLGKW